MSPLISIVRQIFEEPNDPIIDVPQWRSGSAFAYFLVPLPHVFRGESPPLVESGSPSHCTHRVDVIGELSQLGLYNPNDSSLRPSFQQRHLPLSWTLCVIIKHSQASLTLDDFWYLSFSLVLPTFILFSQSFSLFTLLNLETKNTHICSITFCDSIEMELNGPTEPSSQPPSQDIGNMLMTILQAQEAFASSMLSLKEDVDQLKLTPSPQNTLKVPKVSQVAATKPDKNVKNCRAQSEPLPSILTPKKTTNIKSKKTPIATPPPSAKRHPLQLQGKDFPPDFKGVKDVFFKHIKMLWDIKEKDSLPSPPTQSALANFYRKFSNVQQLEGVIKDCGRIQLDTEDDVQAFAIKQLNPVQLGNGMKKLSQTYIDYIQGTLSHLGFTHWSPNLAQNQDELYNVACRIAAVTTFQQLVAGGAYNNFSMNFSYVTNAGLLQKAYNHFVHYLMKGRIEKENKVKGSFKASIMKGNSNTNRARLRNARLDFAILQKLPKRYRKIIEDIAAHSDDKVGGKKNDVYVIRTLGYRSKKANIFFRKLDEAIAAHESHLGIVSRRRTRVLPRVPIVSKNTIPPKGLPMDFYNLKWYKTLSPIEKRMYIDRTNVAFLPDAAQSLEAKRHPDEKCSDKQFNDKCKEDVLKLYEVSEDEEDEEGEDGGESIDLEAESSNEDEEFYGPGEYEYEDNEFSPFEENEEDGEDESVSEDNQGMQGIE
ncbi:hypothetical protein O181_000321 [Austropuccinia psidii MF-1]|uniref:Uncharacterized protein n=1 Tax=Austropuccinia psidii MF-1 TaxID=1389203 RepID=A0A9Q3B8E7_9BASI|nr:hypothetical protein [Austropuccinia psidii MF-1]